MDKKKQNVKLAQTHTVAVVKLGLLLLQFKRGLIFHVMLRCIRYSKREDATKELSTAVEVNYNCVIVFFSFRLSVQFT